MNTVCAKNIRRSILAEECTSELQITGHGQFESRRMAHDDHGISPACTCELVGRWYGSQVQCHCAPAPCLCCPYCMRQIDDQGACLHILVLYGYLAVGTEGHTSLCYLSSKWPYGNPHPSIPAFFWPCTFMVVLSI